MVYSCAVKGCNATSKKNPELSFHRLPNGLDGASRRVRWMKAVTLQGRLTNKTRVCSRHFDDKDYRGANKAKGDTLLPTATPRGNLTTSYDKKPKECIVKITDVKKTLLPKLDLRKALPPMTNGALPTTTNCKDAAADTDSGLVKVEIVEADGVLEKVDEQMCDFANRGMSEVFSFGARSSRNDDDVSVQLMSLASLSGTQLRYFAGVSKQQFSVIRDFVCSPLSPDYFKLSTTLPLDDHLLMTLFYYKHSCEMPFLSNLFDVDCQSCNSLVTYWTNRLHSLLSEIDFWDMNDAGEKGQTVVIDFVEIPVQPCKEQNAHRATFSPRKLCNTFRGLVAISEKGIVTFCSELYGGAVPDRKIFQKSAFLSKVKKGDTVIVDRRYDVLDLFYAKEVTVNVLQSTNGKPGSTDVVLLDKIVANHRSFIERMCKNNAILSRTMPTAVWSLASKIFFNVFTLCNIKNGIL